MDPSHGSRNSEPQRDTEALAQKVAELEARVAFIVHHSYFILLRSMFPSDSGSVKFPELEARVAFLEQTLRETLEELQRILIGNLAHV